MSDDGQHLKIILCSYHAKFHQEIQDQMQPSLHFNYLLYNLLQKPMTWFPMSINTTHTWLGVSEWGRVFVGNKRELSMEDYLNYCKKSAALQHILTASGLKSKPPFRLAGLSTANMQERTTDNTRQLVLLETVKLHFAQPSQ